MTYHSVVLDPAPRPVMGWLRDPEKQTRFGEFCGPCPCPHIRLQDTPDGALACSGECVTPDGHPLGQLTMEGIRQLLRERPVLRFQWATLPKVEMDWWEDGDIVIRSPALFAEYRFTEEFAAEAVLNGDLLMMPDAQGCRCTFQLAPQN